MHHHKIPEVWWKVLCWVLFHLLKIAMIEDANCYSFQSSVEAEPIDLVQFPLETGLQHTII